MNLQTGTLTATTFLGGGERIFWADAYVTIAYSRKMSAAKMLFVTFLWWDNAQIWGGQLLSGPTWIQCLPAKKPPYCQKNVGKEGSPPP